MKKTQYLMALGPVSCEFSEVNLGDKRLTQRACLMAGRLSQNPKESIPLNMKTESETEAAYRFLGNERVTLQELLQTHFERTTLRMQQAKENLVIHDTTDFEFGGEQDREDLGWVRHSRSRKVKKNGMFGHFALAAEFNELVTPLGVIGVETFVRKGKPKWKRHGKTLKRINTKDLETDKWGDLVETVRGQIGEDIAAIHVMDRGADAYSLLSKLVENKERFVIRVCHDRRLVDEEEFDGLFSFLQELPSLCEREVALSARKKTRNTSKSKKHPPRKKRIASLRFSSGEVEIKRSKNLLVGDYPPSLKLNVVRVFEVNVPEGQPAVEWKLITSEPCDSEEKVAKVVDIYRARWTIEDYFKSLKTGCSIEKRQLESRHTIEACLALTIPIAWQLLLIRSMARMQYAHDSEKLLTATQLKILCHLRETKLKKNPTNREILLAVARLGGHIKNNGDPGWIVLGRGFQYLLTLEKGWNAAQKM